MIATLIGTTVMAALAVVAVTAVRGDIPLYSHDLASKRAYEAARSGIEDYAFRLYNDPTYWTKCTSAPGNPSLNQKGSTANRRKVPGDAKAEYAIELIPATRPVLLQNLGHHRKHDRDERAGHRLVPDPLDRVRPGKTKSVVATFKRPSFLDYVYFTQLETSDPVTYGFANPSTALSGAYSQCELSYEQGRYDNKIPGTYNTYCSRISFVTNDDINGPLHTNDTMAICGSPVFGREASDVIETGGASPGWYKTPDKLQRQPDLQRNSDQLRRDPGPAGNELEAEVDRPAPVPLQRPGSNLPQRQQHDRRHRFHLHRQILRLGPLERSRLRRKQRQHRLLV